MAKVQVIFGSEMPTVEPMRTVLPWCQPYISPVRLTPKEHLISWYTTGFI